MRLTVDIMTRGRPPLLLATVESFLTHVAEPDTRIFIACDEDDPNTVAALELARLDKDERVIISVKPREDSRGEKYDRALTEAPADVYLAAVDCVLMKSPGFDTKILEAASIFPDGIGCVYTTMANASFPTFQAPTAKLVEKLGYIYSHDYPFWFIDHELDDIVKMIDRVSFTDIVVDRDSLRPRATIGLRDLVFWCAVFDSQQLQRRAKARSIIEAEDFLDPSWRKQLSLRHHPLIEYRSMWINQGVRQEAKGIEAARGGVDSEADERYLRIKARATKLLLANMAEVEAEADRLKAEDSKFQARILKGLKSAAAA